ncbi:putative alpha/beta hydrolase [Blattamonas nauphoetae]|uniref:Alpha/beta hydrolase n=1 Tax=Blattamonas nauphoetae TaxID=2049346 RepID=A0ABQ9YF94_9EUKA|nr:putative alpha/beta hydrolase [Blattamonas nauphoetae]
MCDQVARSAAPSPQIHSSAKDLQDFDTHPSSFVKGGDSFLFVQPKLNHPKNRLSRPQSAIRPKSLMFKSSLTVTLWECPPPNATTVSSKPKASTFGAATDQTASFLLFTTAVVRWAERGDSAPMTALLNGQSPQNALPHRLAPLLQPITQLTPNTITINPHPSGPSASSLSPPLLIVVTQYDVIVECRSHGHPSSVNSSFPHPPPRPSEEEQLFFDDSEEREEAQRQDVKARLKKEKEMLQLETETENTQGRRRRAEKSDRKLSETLSSLQTYHSRLVNLRNTVVLRPPPSQPDAVANKELIYDFAQLGRLLLHKQHETASLVALMRDRIQNETPNTNCHAIRASQRVSQTTAQFGGMITSDIVNTFVEQAEMIEQLSGYLGNPHDDLKSSHKICWMTASGVGCSSVTGPVTACIHTRSNPSLFQSGQAGISWAGRVQIRWEGDDGGETDEERIRTKLRDWSVVHWDEGADEISGDPLYRHLLKTGLEAAIACEQREHLNRHGFFVDSSTKRSVWYETYGKGPKKVIFVVGFIGHLDDYRHVFIHFLRDGGYEICLFDFPGVGYSEKSKPCFRSSDFAKTVIGLLEHLEWKKTNLFGVSLGGMIALETYAQRPDLFEAAFFGGTTPGPYIPSFSVITLFVRILLSKTQDQVKAVSQNLSISENYRKTFNARYGMTGIESFLLPVFDIPFSEQLTPPWSLVGEALASATHNVSAKRLRAAKKICPRVLVCHGMCDDMIPFKDGEKLAKILDCPLVSYPGVGHLIYLEREEELPFLCLDFFNPDGT